MGQPELHLLSYTQTVLYHYAFKLSALKSEQFWQNVSAGLVTTWFNALCIRNDNQEW